jgi:membrane peptidoglycan carboxypeptidase
MQRTRRKKILALSCLVPLLALGLYSGWIVFDASRQTPQVMEQAHRQYWAPLRPEDLSQERLHMLLAVEDPGFYTHHGIDLTSPGAGYTTITQGLVKHLYFAHFHPGLAKWKQSLVALVFDHQVSKQDQLHLFLNSVYLGNWQGREIYGFDAAAHAYFNKPFAQLTDDEYLSLVAMVVGPNEFHVRNRPDRNADRVARIQRLLAGACKPAGMADVYYQDCR